MTINKDEFNDARKYANVKMTAGAIIVKQGKVLVGRRTSSVENGKWGLIGGHVDIGETAEEGIRREVSEESNLKLGNLKFLFYFDEYLPRIKSHAIVLVFYGEPIGKEEVSDEVSEFAWIGKDDLDKYELAFKHKEILERYWREYAE